VFRLIERQTGVAYSGAFNKAVRVSIPQQFCGRNARVLSRQLGRRKTMGPDRELPRTPPSAGSGGAS